MADASLIETRCSLHTVAERIVATDLWHRTGKFGLRRTPGGFGQPEVLSGGSRHRIRVDGSDLVVLEGDVERVEPITTLAAASAFSGVALDRPIDGYTLQTDLHPGETLHIDPLEATRLANWLALVDEALEGLRRRHRALSPTIAQLWPEHFDLACSMAEVNFGGSPGDEGHPEPYLYVGPWTPLDPTSRTGSFWNEPFGASLTAAEVPDAEVAVAFFEDGLAASR